MESIHTTETDVTRSNIIIPASAKARLAQDMMTGRSPISTQIKVKLKNTKQGREREREKKKVTASIEKKKIQGEKQKVQ